MQFPLILSASHHAEPRAAAAAAGTLRRREEADDAGLLPHRRAGRFRAARQPARSAGMDEAAVRCRDRRRTQGIGRRVGVREGAAASANCLCARANFGLPQL